MTVIDVIRKKILNDMVKAVDPPGRWKVMVVDDEALRILNTVVKLSDLTDEHVISVEALSKGRQPYPDREVIYFISPDPTSVQRIVDDFSKPKPPYAQIHIFCSAPLPDSLFEKIKRSPASDFIRSLKELNVDFSAPESHVFTVDQPASLKTVFNPQSPSLQNYELERIGKRLAAVLASLGEYPYIRYHDPSNGLKPSTNAKLANMVQVELDNLSRIDKNFPPPSQYQRAILLIIDRSADIITPLLHHFTYQSMVMDVLGIADMTYQPPDADAVVKLDQNDVVWNQARHWHIAEVMEYLGEAVTKFTSENKAAAFALNGSGSSLNAIQQLKDTMAHLPQYQEMKTKYSIHTSMCSDAMREFNQNKLERLGQIEQDIATGETAEGKSLRLSLSEVLGIMEDSRILHEDKLRLLMIFLTVQNGLPDADRQKLLDAARLSLEEAQAVHNLSMLGVRLSASLMGKKADNKGQYGYGMRDRGKEFKFENTRYTPVLKYMMEDTVRNMADVNVFPWIREPPPSELGGRPNTWAASGSNAGTTVPTGSMRSKASWANRRAVVSATTDGNSAKGSQTGLNSPIPTENLRANGPRLITFVLGGVTPSEMKAAYDVMKDQQREVIIGSTHLLTPALFLDAMKDLHRHGAQRPARPSARPQQSSQPSQPPPQSRYPHQQFDPPARNNNNNPPPQQQQAMPPSTRPSLAARFAHHTQRPPNARADSAPNQTIPQPRSRQGSANRDEYDRPPSSYSQQPPVANRVANIEARMAGMSVRDDRPQYGARQEPHYGGRPDPQYGGARPEYARGQEPQLPPPPPSSRYARDDRGREDRGKDERRHDEEKEKEKKRGWFHRK
ncbi:hypothetical protein PhCBS80983_g03413 [Powellomyces hirtus]|uniref:Sec1-like protein n=1 Tax=Powellomyces hirtus TaxID=109895 RepID=A0A507E2P1_9FUNG|nr:hypothetical protein PhCBS80983_g03413 [Powellomyces hirtus]